MIKKSLLSSSYNPNPIWASYKYWVEEFNKIVFEYSDHPSNLQNVSMLNDYMRLVDHEDKNNLEAAMKASTVGNPYVGMLYEESWLKIEVMMITILLPLRATYFDLNRNKKRQLERILDNIDVRNRYQSFINGFRKSFGSANTSGVLKSFVRFDSIFFDTLSGPNSGALINLSNMFVGFVLATALASTDRSNAILDQKNLIELTQNLTSDLMLVKKWFEENETEESK